MTLEQLLSMVTNRVAFLLFAPATEATEISVGDVELAQARRIAEGVVHDLLAVGLDIDTLRKPQEGTPR